MEDDVKQSGQERYELSQAYRWRAERDAARQELEKVKSKQLSMTSDDERSEVARRLRELRSGWSSGECYYTIINALGLPDTGREDGGAALYACLADLIEPGEPKVECVAEVKVDGEWLKKLVHDAAVELTGIDRDALLVLADGMERVADENRMTGMMSIGHARSWADRIRDALGVE